MGLLGAAARRQGGSRCVCSDGECVFGECATAVEGAALLKHLVLQAQGRLTVMPGSGVNAGNIAQLRARTGARAFHLSAKRTVESGMVFRRAGVPMGLPMMSEFERFVTNAQAVDAARRALEDGV